MPDGSGEGAVEETALSGGGGADSAASSPLRSAPDAAAPSRTVLRLLRKVELNASFAVAAGSGWEWCSGAEEEEEKEALEDGTRRRDTRDVTEPDVRDSCGLELVASADAGAAGEADAAAGLCLWSTADGAGGGSGDAGTESSAAAVTLVGPAVAGEGVEALGAVDAWGRGGGSGAGSGVGAMNASPS